MTKRTAARAALGPLVLLLWLAPNAVAGPPTHPPLADPIGGYALNHACGIAVDSKGDIYVANAGESKIEVFAPAGNHLTSIADANEPCALAVDSTGRLYVSEKAAGEVLRYTPNAYPLSGSPSYGAPTTIDPTGNAKGIAVDLDDDSVYVAEGTRVAVYRSDGALFTGNETQVRSFTGSPTGGSYKLSFNGAETAAIPYNAPANGPGSIQEALEGLPTIGTANVSVSGNVSEPRITFVGALAGTNVSQLVVDASALVGSGVEIETMLQGFDGHIEGELTGASGVASYTSRAAQSFHRRRYISVADAATGKIKVFVGRLDSTSGAFLPGSLEPRHTVDGSQTPAASLGLSPAGAYLGVDESNGHIYAYDATHGVVNEFEATGQYFTRIASPAFEDAEPTAIAVDRSGGANDGTVYVTGGASNGAELLAFGPVADPSRASLGAPQSRKFAGACGTAVDSAGNLYVAGESNIKVYDATGSELASIADPHRPCWLAVDSKCNLYVANRGFGDGNVVLYEPVPKEPASCHPTGFGPPQIVDATIYPQGVAVDPQTDHLLVTHLESPVLEYGSPSEGSPLLDSEFCGIQREGFGIDVYDATGDVYIVDSPQRTIDVCSPTGSQALSRIDGSGSLGGTFAGFDLNNASLAVDQSNGHLLLGMMESRGAVEEYEASGAFVAQYGSFTKGTAGRPTDLAIDNSSGASKGNLYVAYDDPAPSTFDLTAFGPLAYGEAPLAVTGIASGIVGTSATLNGTVDPNEFAISVCRFEYLTDAQYMSNGEAFTGATSKPCAETSAQIGQGTSPVAVHADLTGLAPNDRYRFRLVAENKYGASEGEARLFGPPLITIKSAQPILYREATSRANIDPAGLETKYRVLYGTTEAYGHSTPVQILPASAGPTDIEAFLTGLAEGTTYHFRLIAENADATVEGPDQQLTTLSRPPTLSCPNETLRLENSSARLPDCRAYELVTPADTQGATPFSGGGEMFNDWFVTPSGPLAGQSLAFFIASPLRAAEGNGFFNAFRATRGPQGWTRNLFSPSYRQTGGFGVSQAGVSSDQLYSFWEFGAVTQPGAFPPGNYLRTPGGFEPIAIGSLGTDLGAEGNFISAAADHVIFTSQTDSAHTAVKLESKAPDPPIGAIYDRSPGGLTHVVSLLPGNVTPTASATYLGATEDGENVVFSIDGRLYVRIDNTETIEIATAGDFAGISSNGKRVFYESSGAIYVCDIAAGPCVGGGAPPGLTKIASSAKFVDVSADGSHAYFTSGGDLELWEGAGTTFIATLAATDLRQAGQIRFPGTDSQTDRTALDSWSADCIRFGGTGRGSCPSRATPDGRFLIFQSHADLTPPYEGQGHSEVYRYDASDGSLLCISCDPSDAPATAEADLQRFFVPAPTMPTTLIPNVTEDGNEVVFQTAAPLLPEDANSVLDVYEWEARGTGGCTKPKGCLALISSGQGDTASYIYSMTPDSHDVFLETSDKLIGSDIAGSPSLYDARVEGGFPQPVAPEPCHGDACQGEGAAAPDRAATVTGVPSSGNARAIHHCRKGQRKVRRAGRVRCVKRRPVRHRQRPHRQGAAR